MVKLATKLKLFDLCYLNFYFWKGLYKLGARKIGVFGVGPIGCLPFYRNTQGGIQRKCVDSLNHKAYSFNNKLSTEINSLINTFPDAKMVYIDFYNFILDLINNPTKYGNYYGTTHLLIFNTTSVSICMNLFPF